MAVVLLAVRHIKRKLVTPALRQYEALADSVALNDKIIEVAPVGLSLVRRADGELIMSNDAARRLLDEHDAGAKTSAMPPPRRAAASIP